METGTASLVVACLLLCYILRRIMLTRKKAPMAPSLNWFTGHTQLFNSENPLQILQRFCEQVGPVFRLRFLIKEVVVICNFEAAHEALSEKKEAFAGRPLMDIVTYIQSEGRRNILFQDWSPHLKKNKQVAMQALARFATGDKIEEYVTENFTKLAELLPLETGVDPEPLIYSLIFSVLSTSLFGKVVDFDDPELIWLRKQNDDLTDDFMMVRHPSDIHPSLVGVRMPGMTRLEQRAEKVLNFYTDKVTAHLQVNDFNGDGRLFDIVDHLLDEMRVDKTDARWKDRSSDVLLEVRQIVQDIFMAGTETTRNQFLWVILFLALFPEWQTKIFDELQANCQSDEDMLRCRSNMPLMLAFLNECQRCGTVSLVTSAHQTTCDTEILGYQIPKGTSVLFNQYAIHRDETFWRNSTKFDPKRFLPGSVDTTKSFQPFSSGLRRCAGESVARSILYLLTCHFVRKYNMVTDPGEVALRGKTAEHWYRPHMFFGTPVPFKIKFQER